MFLMTKRPDWPKPFTRCRGLPTFYVNEVSPESAIENYDTCTSCLTIDAACTAGLVK